MIDTVLGSRVVESGAVEEGIGVVVDPMNSSSDPLMQTVARIDIASTKATMEAQTQAAAVQNLPRLLMYNW